MSHNTQRNYPGPNQATAARVVAVIEARACAGGAQVAGGGIAADRGGLNHPMSWPTPDFSENTFSGGAS